MASTKRALAKRRHPRRDSDVRVVRRAESHGYPGQPLGDGVHVLHDAWANVLSGLGTARDRRNYTNVDVALMSPDECEWVYRGDWLAAKCADEPAREMTRKWLDVKVEGDKDTEEAIEQKLDDLEMQLSTMKALIRQRFAGGSLMVLGCDDGVSDPALPLNVNRLRDIKFVHVYSAREAWPRSYYLDPDDPKYGLPDVYVIRAVAGQPQTYVHETRCIKWQGIEVSRQQIRGNRMWGDSIYVRLMQVLMDFGMASGGAAHLMSEFSQAIIRMKGLADAIETGNEELVRSRLENMEMGRSIVRALLLDAGDGTKGDPGETWERQSVSLAGLAESLDRLMTIVAAAVDMPVSRLFGTQKTHSLGGSGGDAAGETWWNERITGLQVEQVRPGIKEFLRFLFACKEGPTAGKTPKKWSIQFRPLREVDPLQEAQRRFQIAQADGIYLDRQVVDPAEVAMSRFGGDGGYSADITLDNTLRDKFGALEPPEPSLTEKAAAVKAGIVVPGVETTEAPAESPQVERGVPGQKPGQATNPGGSQGPGEPPLRGEPPRLAEEPPGVGGRKKPQHEPPAPGLRRDAVAEYEAALAEIAALREKE